jgi:hypothetical protein
MATLERIHFVPHYLVRKENVVTYSASNSRPSIEGLPHIFWADSTPWREANLWVVERATTGEVSSIGQGKYTLQHFSRCHVAESFSWPFI